MTCPSFEEWLAALDEGRVVPERAHDEACATCSSSRADARALLAAVRAAVPRSTTSAEALADTLCRRAGRRPRWLLLGAPAAIAACLLLLFWPPLDPPVPRGSVGGAICEVYRVRPAGLERLEGGARLPERAELAFAVGNRSEHRAWVGIFVVTDRATVGWYHPAYQTAADDPTLVEIEPKRRGELLAEVVSLPLGEGRARVFCWLAERRWRVRDADAKIEAIVDASSDPASIEGFPPLGGIQESVELWFEPQR